jgi:hypothetical protein
MGQRNSGHWELARLSLSYDRAQPGSLIFETTLDEPGQRIQGRRGVGPLGFQFQPGAVGGCERRQVENASSICLAAVARNVDNDLKLLGYSHEFVGSPEVETLRVDDFDLSAVREHRAFVAARRFRQLPVGDGGIRPVI